MEIIYLAITATAVGLELCAILNAATCSVFGPGKFLRGKGGLKAAELAVQVLEDKSEITLTYFMLGLYSIVISSCLKAFLLYTLWNACVVAAGLVFITHILIKSGRRIFNNMYVEKDKAITGKIQRDQVHDPTDIKF